MILNKKKRKCLENKGTEKKRKRKSRKKGFAERLEELKAFKEEHGHCNVPRSADGYRSLYDWGVRTKALYWNICQGHKPDSLLSKEQIRDLDGIGFQWGDDPASKQVIKIQVGFDSHFADLSAFKEKHGHCRVSATFHRALYEWCLKKKQAYWDIHEGKEKPRFTLKVEQTKALDDLGFDWGKGPSQRPSMQSFDTRLEALKAYKEEHGHCRVQSAKNRSLYEWSMKRREAYKDFQTGKSRELLLSEKQIKALDAIGFEWIFSIKSAYTSFEERMESLKAFKEEHGHCLVSVALDKPLYRWCVKTRKKVRDSQNNESRCSLSSEQIKALDDVGFEWNPKYVRKNSQDIYSLWV
jgi:hypothetical protein